MYGILLDQPSPKMLFNFVSWLLYCKLTSGWRPFLPGGTVMGYVIVSAPERAGKHLLRKGTDLCGRAWSGWACGLSRRGRRTAGCRSGGRGGNLSGRLRAGAWRGRAARRRRRRAGSGRRRGRALRESGRYRGQDEGRNQRAHHCILRPVYSFSISSGGMAAIQKKIAQNLGEICRKHIPAM